MKTASALLLALLVSGCATQRMDIKDLSQMQIDCANKDAQIKFLESQMTTPGERLVSTVGMNAFTEFMAHWNGEQTQARSVRNREYDSVAKNLIWDLRTRCADYKVAIRR